MLPVSSIRLIISRNLCQNVQYPSSNEYHRIHHKDAKYFDEDVMCESESDGNFDHTHYNYREHVLQAHSLQMERHKINYK